MGRKRRQTIVKTKSVVAVALLLFVAASVIYLIVSGFRARTENTGGGSSATVAVAATSNPVPSSGAEQVEHRVIAYYFHGTSRCRTCLTIEQYANEALTTGFAEELQSGVLEWRAINAEEPANQHFIEDYQLVTRSLVLVEMEGENQVRWKNLERIWELVSDREAFISYVRDETRAYLERNQ
jgi:hypothetical protein